jgi:PAS domain S-box-containing protein
MARPPGASSRKLDGPIPDTRVLLVDDDHGFIQLASEFLKAGCIEAIDVASSGKEALDRLKENEYDVVLCDHRMPGIDGLQVLKEIRSWGDSVPFVMLAGDSSDDLAEDAFASGANCCIQKRGDIKAQFVEISALVRNLACRRRVEKHLGEELDLYKFITDTSMIGILVVNTDGRVVIWNKGIVRLTGVRSEEAVGQPLSLESSPILARIVDRWKTEELLKGNASSMSTVSYMEAESGKTRYFEVGYFPIPDDKGQLRAGMIPVLESTDRVEIAHALESSEEKHRQLVEFADEGIWAVDNEDRITFANPRMASMMASSHKQMLGRRISELVSDDAKDFADEALSLCREGTDVELDFEFTNAAGKHQFVSLKASPIRGPEGEYLGAVAVFTDLATRKLMEDALVEALRSREALERIVNASPVVVFRLNPIPPWYVEFISDNVTQFGYTPDMFGPDGITFAEIVHPDDLERVFEEVQRQILSSEDLFELDFRGLTRAGEARWIGAHVFMNHDVAGTVTSLQGVIMDVTERVSAAQEIERLASIVNDSRDAIVSKSTDGTIQTWNPAAESMYGYSAEEAIGKPITMLVPPENIDEFHGKFRQVKRGIHVPPYEATRVRKDGSRVDVSLTVSPVRDSSGKVIGASAVARDISDRKRFIEALRKSEEKFSKAFENSPNILAIISTVDFRILDMNETGARIAGLSREEIIGRSAFEVPFIDPDIIEDNLDELMKGGSLKRVEFEFSDASGKRHDGLLFVEMIEIDGEPCALAVASDVTEQKQAERQLKAAMESLEKLRIIVSTSPAVALLWTSEEGWPIEYISDNVSQFGYSAEDIISNRIHFLDLVHPEDRQYVVQLSDESKAREPARFRAEYRLLTKSGGKVWVEERTYAFRDDSGQETFGCGVLLDITDRKKAEDALKAANEKLNLLGSITRHDVVNQIGILSGYLSLAEGDSDDHMRAEHLEAARKACRVMAEQLQFAGSYQKAGTKDPEWTRVRLELAASGAVIDMGGVKVTDTLGDLEVLADPMFEKVFLNLLMNTRRHAEKATHVRVESERRGEDLVIRYTDNGIGIPEEEKEMIFQRGYGKDSGLGLFLTREILGITGISMREVGEPGKGVVFELVVPEGKYRTPSRTNGDAG